jgi:hypothetical protein
MRRVSYLFQHVVVSGSAYLSVTPWDFSMVIGPLMAPAWGGVPIRMIGTQLNVQEARHRLTRKIARLGQSDPCAGATALGAGAMKSPPLPRAAHADQRSCAITSGKGERMASDRLQVGGLAGSVVAGTGGEFSEEHRWWCDLALATDWGGCQRYEQVGGG